MPDHSARGRPRRSIRPYLVLAAGLWLVPASLVAQASGASMYEFGLEAGSALHRGSELLVASTTPVSLRFSGTNVGHPVGVDWRLSWRDQRHRNGQAPMESSTQVTYRLAGRAHRQRTMAGPFVLAGFSANSGKSLAERGIDAGNRLLFGWHTGVGARIPAPAGVVRTELWVGSDQGWRGGDGTVLVPGRQSVGVRAGYSRVWYR